MQASTLTRLINQAFASIDTAHEKTGLRPIGSPKINPAQGIDVEMPSVRCGEINYTGLDHRDGSHTFARDVGGYKKRWSLTPEELISEVKRSLTDDHEVPHALALALNTMACNARFSQSPATLIEQNQAAITRKDHLGILLTSESLYKTALKLPEIAADTERQKMKSQANEKSREKMLVAAVEGYGYILSACLDEEMQETASRKLISLSRLTLQFAQRAETHGAKIRALPIAELALEYPAKLPESKAMACIGLIDIANAHLGVGQTYNALNLFHDMREVSPYAREMAKIDKSDLSQNPNAREEQRAKFNRPQEKQIIKAQLNQHKL